MRARAKDGSESIWLFGLHAVKEALTNPKRDLLRLIVTPNAKVKLKDAIEQSGLTPEIVDPRKFSPPLDAGSVHQGIALKVRPLDWGGFAERCREARLLVLLDRVMDPHNVGAILRSAEVFGAQAVIGTRYHSAPESGALAKAASGTVERQPYLRVSNLATTIRDLKESGFFVVGLDADADQSIDDVIVHCLKQPVAIVLGAEGRGLRPKTRTVCDHLAKIATFGNFGSLNVSNAAAVSLYALSRHQQLE